MTRGHRRSSDGIMRFLFYNSAASALGIEYLIPALRAEGHDVSLYLDPSLNREYVSQDFLLKNLFSLSHEMVYEDIMALRPEIIGFSLSSIYFKSYLGIIQHIKRKNPDIIIVCGGVHATLVPDRVLEHREIDFAVVGEAEYSLPALVNAIAEMGPARVKALPADALPGVWSMYDGALQDRGLSPVPLDLNTLAFPDKDLVYAANPKLALTYSAGASRGCFFSCTYCNSPSMRKMYTQCKMKYHRIRSVDNVIEELRLAKERYHPKHVEFYDETFAADRLWLEEFSHRYKDEIGLPYGAETHPMVLDKEKLKLLADSGCVVLELGFQSANQYLRENILRRNDRTDRVGEVLRWAEEFGIGIELDLIVNLPGETIEHVRETIAFIQAMRPPVVNLSFLQYLPKAEIIDKAIAHGILSANDIPAIEAGENIGPLRFLPKSCKKNEYRLLPTQVFMASRLPARLSRRLIPLIEKPVLSTLFIVFAPVLIYSFRFYMAVFDRKNYFLRWHMWRVLYSMKRVIRRKFFGKKTWWRFLPAGFTMER